MKLLLDEMLSPVIAREMRARGYDVQAVAGHFGMIFMSGNYRRTRSDIGRIIAALEAKIGQYPGDDGLANAEEWP